MAGWPRVGKEQTIQKHLDSTHIRERHTTTPLHATYPGSQALSLSTDLPSHKALLTTVSTAPTSLVPHLGTMATCSGCLSPFCSPAHLPASPGLFRAACRDHHK